MRRPTTYESIAIGSTITLSIIAIMFALPQIDLVITGPSYDKNDNHLYFQIANNGDKIAYVDKIELEITNLQLLDECDKHGLSYLAIYPKLMVPLEITMNEHVYQTIGFLENVKSVYPEGNTDYYPIENGLKYGKGDLDGFHQPIYLVNNNGTRVYSGYSFDAKIKVYWCEVNQCNEKRILESSKITGVDYKFCPNI